MSESPSDDVTAAIQAYEDGTADFDTTSAVIKAACGQTVDRYVLDNYWRAESLEDFVARLVIQPIANWSNIDDAHALELIAEIKADPCNTPVIERNCEAFAKRYRKSQGSVLDLFFRQDLTADAILAELKKDTVIYL
jgi:hypothetical protein